MEVNFICPMCFNTVETNGVGPAGRPKFNWLLRKIYFKSCKLFRNPARWHDFHYHILGFEKRRADRLFLAGMLKAVKNRENNWFTERWFKYQANKFYLAVKYGGQDAYKRAQLECLRGKSGAS